MPKLELHRKDPNPWPGKPAVPGVLLRMLLDDSRWTREYTTNTARHEAMIEQACKVAAQKQGVSWQESYTVSASVWSRELEGYQLSNALRDLSRRGYKPAKADNRLSDFVKIIRAGVPDAPPNASLDYLNYGAGIHEVRFYRANEMWYRGEFYNVQWSKRGKKCGPLEGSAKAIIYRDKKRHATGLFGLLTDSVTRAEWSAIRQIAHDAEQRHGARIAVRRLKQQKDQQMDELAATLGLDAEAPKLNTEDEGCSTY